MNGFPEFNLEEINKKGMKKAYITEKLLKYSVYFSLIPSIFYNGFFIFFINDNLKKMVQADEAACESLHSWAHTVLVWTTIGCVKASLFLFCLKCNSGEDGDSNDCNVICLMIKALTSYIPAIVFNYKLADLIEAVFSNDICSSLQILLQQFKYFEYYYVCSITTIILMVPAMAILMSIKELWKSVRS